ncbi:MAG TPA: helix-turn-helix transcriptional regulator [Polyangiaceae bacterium]|nr:helix-turn-helix transcriptional regulator [Polyangiaceae bacterium]
MKRARPPLPDGDLTNAGVILTTADAARLLRVHPKHVYRLLRRGLPGHRVGGEWRFVAEEVLRWSGAHAPPEALPRGPVAASRTPPPLLAANGDVAVERLLARLKGDDTTSLGFVQADRGEGLELLRRGWVLAAGCHGGEIPGALEDRRLAFIQIVDRQVGLVHRSGARVGSLRSLGRRRLASRPATAGVRLHFDGELRRHGVDAEALHTRATLFPSHREVVCAIARGEMDVGVATLAWAQHVGLACAPFCRETYGLVVRAEHLGDPRVVRLCEVAQSASFREEIAGVAGYRAEGAGSITYPTVAPHGGESIAVGARTRP